MNSLSNLIVKSDKASKVGASRRVICSGLDVGGGRVLITVFVVVDTVLGRLVVVTDNETVRAFVLPSFWSSGFGYLVRHGGVGLVVEGYSFASLLVGAILPISSNWSFRSINFVY